MFSKIRRYIEEALIKVKKNTEIILHAVKDEHAPSSSSCSNMGVIMHHLRLPEEIIEEILVRLPVKSIIRFQCVSKSWFLLITSNRFIHKHLISSEESFLVRMFLVGNHQRETCSWSRKCVIIRSMNICDIQIQAVDPVPLLNFELPRPPFPDLQPLEFVVQCNGVVCLTLGNFILLVNPSLKQVRNLPIPPVCDAGEYCKLVGFGFDDKTMDFKVVRMLRLNIREGVHRQRFEIYSLKSNAWRKLDEFSLVSVDYVHDRRSTFLNGVIHWCVKPLLFGWRMLIFNMATELLQQIEFPQGWDKRENKGSGEGRIIPNLFVLNQDSLAFASYPSNCGSSNFVDIWTMNKENKEETWTKLYSIGPLTQFGKPITLSKKHRFIYQTLSGKIILYDLLSHQSCVVCDDVSQLPYDARARCLELIIELGECRPSLVSVNNSTCEETESDVLFQLMFH